MISMIEIVQKFIRTKLISKYMNFIVINLPRFIRVKIKYISELNYWYIRSRIEGKEVFIQEESLRNTFMRYCSRLEVNKNTFKDKIVIDVGCGPRGTLHYFNAKLKIGADPLANFYRKFFNVDKQDMIYINSEAENIQLDDNFADFVISVNALDHVENFKQTIKEIYRILKPEGIIIFQLNFNKKPTVNEPILLDYSTVKNELEEFFTYKVVKETEISLYITEKSIVVKGKKKS